MTCTCGCQTGRVHLVANLAGPVRHEAYKGRDHIVVPVVMLRQTVVNKAYVAKDQLEPYAWNGTPVTVDHPVVNGQTITANSPRTLEQWQIGQVFNCKLKGDRLVGEAWVDIEHAEQIRPGLVAQLEAGSPMDVSTGYFPTSTKAAGVYNGKPYTAIHTELKPDHLALLPDDTGACSWQDGCGVRVNKRTETMTDPATSTDDQTQQRGMIAALLGALMPPKTNARGSDDDRRQTVADLLSDDNSPFTPDDMYSLMELTSPALAALRATYLTAPATNQQQTGDPDMSDPTTPATNAAPKVSDMSVEDFTALVTNTAKAAADTAVTEALAANRRQELAAGLVANAELGLTEDELKAMPVSALEKLAANAAQKPATNTRAPARAGANYAGRGLTTNANDGTGGEAKYPGMVANGQIKANTTASETTN